jgi:hypothetical protein
MCKGLIAPKTYRDASKEERAAAIRDRSPQSHSRDLVPDKLLGLHIGCACDVHDWMYEEGGDARDRRVADAVFFLNMCKIIDDEGGLLRIPRKLLARWYFRAVVAFGKDAFNRSET